jgi:hypothetical protein
MQGSRHGSKLISRQRGLRQYGYSADPVLAKFKLDGFSGIRPKPFFPIS